MKDKPKPTSKYTVIQSTDLRSHFSELARAANEGGRRYLVRKRTQLKALLMSFPQGTEASESVSRNAFGDTRGAFIERASAGALIRITDNSRRDGGDLLLGPIPDDALGHASSIDGAALQAIFEGMTAEEAVAARELWDCLGHLSAEEVAAVRNLVHQVRRTVKSGK